LLILAISSALTNIVLIFTGQKDLSVYFTIDVIVFLVITLLHVYLNPRARRSLGIISVVLFAGFAVIVALRVVGVLTAK
jgi:hypothetical protein